MPTSFPGLLAFLILGRRPLDVKVRRSVNEVVIYASIVGFIVVLKLEMFVICLVNDNKQTLNTQD